MHLCVFFQVCQHTECFATNCAQILFDITMSIQVKLVGGLTHDSPAYATHELVRIHLFGWMTSFNFITVVQMQGVHDAMNAINMTILRTHRDILLQRKEKEKKLHLCPTCTYIVFFW